MTFITQVYEQLKTANIVSSGEDFSVRFLKRSPKYYSAIKAQGRDARIELLVELRSNLSTTREQLEQVVDVSSIGARYCRWATIEQTIQKEIMARVEQTEII
jgi:acetolactate synthase regulatory subunit